MSARRRRAARRQERHISSDDDEVVLKTSGGRDSVSVAADAEAAAAVETSQDGISTLPDSDDEAPEAVGFAGSRREAELLLQDLAETERRREDRRKKKTRDLQQRNRDQKLDKQRRLELELSQEIADELAAEEAEEQQLTKPRDLGTKDGDGGARKPKRKRFTYDIPETATDTAALDFIPLEGGAGTEFRARVLPASLLPSVTDNSLVGLKERLLYGGRIKRTSAKGLKQIRHKQQASGKYERR